MQKFFDILSRKTKGLTPPQQPQNKDRAQIPKRIPQSQPAVSIAQPLLDTLTSIIPLFAIMGGVHRSALEIDGMSLKYTH